MIIQKQFKGRTARKKFKDTYDASILLQSGTEILALIVAGPLSV